MSWLTGAWSMLYRLSDRDRGAWFRSCEDRPGVYRLVGLQDDPASLQPALLNRACGQDEFGTLYIGAATRSLQSRLAQLVAQHLPPPSKGRGHVAMPMALARTFPASRLAVCWSYVGHDVDAFATERTLLVAYRDVFGERPPLNTMG